MPERRKVRNEAIKYERQAKAQMGLKSLTSRSNKKRGYDREKGSLSPLICGWSDTAPSSRQSSFSPSHHPTTGGKTISLEYYNRLKRSRVAEEDGDTDDEDGQDGDEDIGSNSEEAEQKTYGGKTIKQGDASQVSQYDVKNVLWVVKEKTSLAETKSSDESDDTESSSNTDSEVENGDEKGNRHGSAEARIGIEDNSGNAMKGAKEMKKNLSQSISDTDSEVENDNEDVVSSGNAPTEDGNEDGNGDEHHDEKPDGSGNAETGKDGGKEN
ncbi:conserved hypothetical protein [Talaromyces stipitatus ATCC 10500]|uniref:Uncharacterized protein n=1 Tax=Talaromyces stipitatus (strain ATCC 10500 / CBS 375.48 / QM 6759 / NRRL 1006) TaxID=441959 RepID=B8MIW5_TALSN|nr:uncharacterized protein TSTA_050650 [Talaromyces stipitatus ATCC 10500]EED15627.1 conserved hypothetical protein [Talaromyces stipitatus ATCC 10500]